MTARPCEARVSVPLSVPQSGAPPARGTEHCAGATKTHHDRILSNMLAD